MSKFDMCGRPLVGALLAVFSTILVACSSPDNTGPQTTDSGSSPDTYVADSGIAPDTFVPETGADAPACKQGTGCAKQGDKCGGYVCTNCGWQISESDCDAGPPPDVGADTFDASPETSPDTGTDSGTDSGSSDTMDSTVVDSGVDSGSPDSGIDTGTDSGSDSGLPDTGTPDSGTDTGPVDSGPPKSLTCTTPGRIVPFDSVTVGCPSCSVEEVGHGWSAGKDSDYLPVRNGGKEDVIHWNGTSVSNESIPGPPNWAVGLWGTGEDNIWLAANDLANGSLRHKTGGVWVLDSTQPAAKRFNDLTGSSATEMFLIGNDPSWTITVWKGNGTGWTALPKLPSSDWFSPGQLYAAGSGRVALAGYDIDSVTSAPQRVAVYVYDGSSWTKILSPSTEDFVIGSTIHGTSTNELWIGGATSAPKGKICKLNSLSAWTCYTSSGTTTATKSDFFGPVYTPWTGAVVAGGLINPFGLGAARIMTVDPLTSPPTASSIDSKAASVGTIWREPGTSTYLFAHSGKTGVPAGLYRFTCD